MITKQKGERNQETWNKKCQPKREHVYLKLIHTNRRASVVTHIKMLRQICSMCDFQAGALGFPGFDCAARGWRLAGTERQCLFLLHHKAFSFLLPNGLFRKGLLISRKRHTQPRHIRNYFALDSGELPWVKMAAQIFFPRGWSLVVFTRSSWHLTCGYRLPGCTHEVIYFLFFKLQWLRSAKWRVESLTSVCLGLTSGLSRETPGTWFF